jgi:hypothetical protein
MLVPQSVFCHTPTVIRKAILLMLLSTAVALPAWGAEKVFDFSNVTTNGIPVSFSKLLLGKGKPGDWKIAYDDVPPLLAPITDKAPSVAKRAVLAQVSEDRTDERFPMLVYDGETFGDFTLSTRFKLVSGTAEQMAGLVFRLKDEKNFFVVRASGLGRNVRFYNVVDGQRGTAYGPEIEVTAGVWHELRVECTGNQIIVQFDGKNIMAPVIDNTFLLGKVGLWTKSDAVTYFADTKITYIPREIPAQKLVREAVKKYTKLKGLKVYTLNSDGEPKMVASKDEDEKGTPGGTYERNCIKQGEIYYGKDKENKTVSVVMPLRDRNGDAIAAVRVVMESFAGQTEQNALARATPVVKEMQAQVQTLTELIE